MAGRQTARPAARKPVPAQWMDNIGDLVERQRREAEAKGREIVERAIRVGLPVVAKTTEDLRELGAKAIAGQAAAARFTKGVAAVAKDPHSAEAQRFIKQTKKNLDVAKAQATAAAHGAGDAFTMGAADRVSAGVRAAWQSRDDLGQLDERYHQNMEAERAQDRLEQQRYGVARTVGQVAGTVGQMAVLGGLAQSARAAQLATRLGSLPGIRVMAIPQVARLPEAAKMIAPEYAALAGGGGTAGVVSQGVNDAASGRLSSGRDYAAAFAGGSIGALGAKLGPAGAGALGGVATSLAHDGFGGQPISLQDALIDGVLGGVSGGLVGNGAAGWADSLNSRSKGKLGEQLSRARSVARGNGPIEGPHREYLTSGGYTVPDHRVHQGIVEAKFGRRPELSNRQREAMGTPFDLDGNPRSYRVDHFIPQDVGLLFSFPMSQMITSFRPDEDDIPPRR